MGLISRVSSRTYRYNLTFMPILLEARTQAPAPSKDYIHFYVTPLEVVLTVIPINPACLKFTITPKTMRLTFEEFLLNVDSIKEKLNMYFPEYYEKVHLICRGHHDPFNALPKPAVIDILKKLKLEDILSAAKSSEVISQICEEDDLWEALYKQHLKTTSTSMSDEMEAFAQDIGWKNLYFSRIIDTRRSMKKYTSPIKQM